MFETTSGTDSTAQTGESEGEKVMAEPEKSEAAVVEHEEDNEERLIEVDGKESIVVTPEQQSDDLVVEPEESEDEVVVEPETECSANIAHQPQSEVAEMVFWKIVDKHQRVKVGRETEVTQPPEPFLSVQSKAIPVPVINGLEQASDAELRQLVLSLHAKLCSVEMLIFQMKDDFESRVSQVEQDGKWKAAELNANLEATEDLLIAEFLRQQKKARDAVKAELSRLKACSASTAVKSVDDEEENVVPPGSMTTATMAVPCTLEQHKQKSTMSLLDFGELDNMDMALRGDSTFREHTDMRQSALERAKAKIHSAKRVTKHLTRDTFSFMIIAPTHTTPFILSIGVASLQLFSFFLLAINMVNTNGGTNPFNIPTNVKPWVRVAQVVCLVVAVVLQNDLITSFDLFRSGFRSGMAESFDTATMWKYLLSTSLRFLEGSASLLLIFMLAVSSESVLDLLLNFTALEFVSQFDEAFFFLSRHGFLGLACEEMTYTLLRTSYSVPRQPLDRIFKMLCMLVFFAVLLIGWGIVSNEQVHGKFLCQTIMVQFGDDMPDLGAFAGLYDKKTKDLKSFSSKHVEYIGRGLQKAKIAYCDNINAWTFNWQEHDVAEIDPCKWKARSADTDAFDVTLTASTTWYFRDEYNREIVLEPFYLSCYDCGDPSQECSGRGSCSDAVCNCTQGFGSRCEFKDPCPTLQVSADHHLGGFPGIRKWSNDFELLSDSNGTVVAYERPVYIGRAGASVWNVLVFTGRRWLATYLDSFQDIKVDLSKGTDGIKTVLAHYFRNEFHGYWSNYETEFLSEPMDVGTLGDGNSPVGLNWYFAKARVKGDTGSIQGVDLSLRVQTILLCSLCNNETNPCQYDGVCLHGECSCSLGSSGSICEQPPIGNGHCDKFFNWPESNLDGGDCCSSTCITSPDFFCGFEDSGFLSVGYPFCKLPSNEWKVNSGAIIGEAGSSSGYGLALSPSGNFLVTSGHGSKDKFYVYDKDGSEWNLRATVPLSNNSDDASHDFDLVKLDVREVNIGQVNNPAELAPLEITFLKNSTRQLHMYICENVNQCQLRYAYPRLSTSDSVPDESLIWFDIDTQGGVVLVRDYGIGSDMELDIILPKETGYEFAYPDVYLKVPNDSILDVALSDDHKKLAVLTRTRRSEDMTVTRTRRSEDMTLNALTYSWNGTNFDLINKTALGNVTTWVRQEVLSPIGKGSLELSRDGLVMAVAMCDTQERVHVFSWGASGWAKRPTPPITGIACNWTDEVSTVNPPPNSYLKLSRSGDVLAFVENFNNSGSGAAPQVWKWSEAAWEPVGNSFSMGKSGMAIGLSSDGLALALGMPFARLDNAGQLSIYSRPQGCSANASLWRFTHYLLPSAKNGLRIPWVLARSTGEVVQSGVLTGDPSRTFVTKRCLEDTANECYTFTAFTDNGMELSSVVAYEMFLNGVRLSSDFQDTRFTHRHLIGKCSDSSTSPPNCTNGESNLKVIDTQITGTPGQDWSITDLSTNVTVLKNEGFADVEELSETTKCVNIDSGCYVFKSNGFVEGDFGVRLYVNERVVRYPRSDSGPVFLGKGNDGCCPGGQVRAIFQLSSCGPFQWNLSLSDGFDLAYGRNLDILNVDCSPLDGSGDVKWETECLDIMLCYNFTVVHGKEVTNARVWFSKNDVGVVQKGSYNETILFGNCTNSYLYGDATVDPIPLNLSVPLISQSGYTDQQYIVEEIPLEMNITCKLQGDIGNIALVAYFQREPDIRCSSFNADTSVERCTVGPSMYNNSALIVEVQTMHPYTDLTITCKLEGVDIDIVDGVPMTGLESDWGDVQTFVLDPISLSDRVSCTLKGNNGDADLFIYFEGEDNRGCYSYNDGSNEYCAIGPAVNVTTLYAEVVTWKPFTDVTLTCSIQPAGNITSFEVDPNAMPLLSGEILGGLSARTGDVLTFVIENVTMDDYVSCTLRGDNGDADLSTFFPYNKNNGCLSASDGSSNEDCVIGPAEDDTFVSILIDAYGGFSDLSISCDIFRVPT